MLYLRRRQISIVFTLLLAISCTPMFGQRPDLNLPDHEDKPFYFGITFSYNRASFNATLHPKFLTAAPYDSIAVADPFKTGGFSMGFSSIVRLSKRFELRYNPQLMFVEKSIQYNLNYPITTKDETPVMVKKIESIIVTNPFHIILNSDRFGNFSFYSFGGVKFDLDLASNARKKRAEELVKINKYDLGVEAGVGFKFYFKSFIFTPEIKISNGLRNIHFRDENLKFSSAIDQLRTRMIIFSLHLQG
jgi:Outer membrane protein beta-barrel domain